MFNARRFFGFLASGVIPEMTALDESLEEHDKKYHGGRFDPKTQTCGKRNAMGKDDRSDRVETGGEKRVNGVTAAEDSAYMDAVKRGDMETARRMVREAAANADIVLDDGNKFIYKDGELRYTKEDDEFILECVNVPAQSRRKGISKRLFSAAFQRASELGLPATGYMYPQDDATEISWLRDYYENLGFEIDSYDLVRWEGRGTGDVVKSADPVTYDDVGNIIPLSRRFDDGDDIRGDVKGR